MPYIKQKDRKGLNTMTEYATHAPETPGELNYVFSIIIKDYFDHSPNYQGINDIIGALEGAKMEFYRRVAVPYEDTKIKENGDVY